MASVDSDGVPIHYEVEGSGPPLVLQHGFSDSLESWYESGYVGALADRYQVILIDARGHGESGKPHDSQAYSSVQMVRDVTAVLDAESVDKTHFFGYSMGGHIARDMAKYSPDRLLSLVIGAAATSISAESKTAFPAVLEKGIDEFVKVWEQQSELSDALRGRLLTNDTQALIAFMTRTEDEDVTVEALRTLGSPYLLVAGDQDPAYPRILDFAGRLRANALVTIKGTNHLETFMRSDLLLPHLLPFFSAATARH